MLVLRIVVQPLLRQTKTVQSYCKVICARSKQKLGSQNMTQLICSSIVQRGNHWSFRGISEAGG